MWQEVRSFGIAAKTGVLARGVPVTRCGLTWPASDWLKGEGWVERDDHYDGPDRCSLCFPVVEPIEPPPDLFFEPTSDDERYSDARALVARIVEDAHPLLRERPITIRNLEMLEHTINLAKSWLARCPPPETKECACPCDACRDCIMPLEKP